MIDHKGKIDNLWHWFIGNEGMIKKAIEDETSSQRMHIVEQLNNLVLDIGTFTWDIGLNDNNDWFFTVSPNGDKDLFEISQKIMESSPDHLDWLFYSSKPPKCWDQTFVVYDDSLDEVYIDAKSWNFYIGKKKNDGFQLIFETTNILHLDPETAQTAVNTFLVSEIGEERRMNLISSVLIVDLHEVKIESDKYAASEIKKVLNIGH